MRRETSLRSDYSDSISPLSSQDVIYVKTTKPEKEYIGCVPPAPPTPPPQRGGGRNMADERFYTPENKLDYPYVRRAKEGYITPTKDPNQHPRVVRNLPVSPQGT